jgi:cytochrome c
VDAFKKKQVQPSGSRRSTSSTPYTCAVGLAAQRSGLVWTLLGAAFLTTPVIASASDAAAARDLAQASGCFKCHGVDKKKDGPALRDVAAKYKGAQDAEGKLINHVTSGEMVKFDDGHEEHHKKVKTDSPTETRNLVQWILDLPGGTKP